MTRNILYNMKLRPALAFGALALLIFFGDFASGQESHDGVIRQTSGQAPVVSETGAKLGKADGIVGPKTWEDLLGLAKV